MKRNIVMLIGLALVLCVTASQGDWMMRIHKGVTVEEHTLTDIDSLTFFDGPINLIEMVFVPAGVFIMGDGGAETYCGQDEREVTLTRDFYLGQHEVTNQEYLDAVQWAFDNGHVTATDVSVLDHLDYPAGGPYELMDLDGECEISFSNGIFSLHDDGHGLNPDHPVIGVTWHGSARYCDWLSMQADLPRAYQYNGDWLCNDGDPYGAEGYRLPTDAEWEYATQFDGERLFPWGNEEPDCSLANHKDNSYDYCVQWTSPVGNYPDAPAALGLSDMAGNVSERVNDIFVCYLGTSPETDPTGPPEYPGAWVLRGGNWTQGDLYLWCAARFPSNGPAASFDIGFRVARTVSP